MRYVNPTPCFSLRPRNTNVKRKVLKLFKYREAKHVLDDWLEAMHKTRGAESGFFAACRLTKVLDYASPTSTPGDSLMRPVSRHFAPCDG